MNTGKLFLVSLITVLAAFSAAKIPAQAFSGGLSSTISDMIWAGSKPVGRRSPGSNDRS